MFNQRQAALCIRLYRARLCLAYRWAVLVAASLVVPVASAAPSAPEASPPASAAPNASHRSFIPMVGDPPPQPTPRPSSAPQPSASPRPIAPPDPGAPSPNAGSVLQPYFFDKPRDGTSTSTIAKTVSWVSLSRGNGWRHELRDAGYNGPILVYFMGLEVEGAGPYKNSSASCDASLYPASNTVAYERGDFCKYVHPNESWFLHNGRGDRLYDRRGSTSVSYQMNPASSGWRQYVRERLARDLYGGNGQAALENFDGIFLDNIAMRLYKLQHQIVNSDGKVEEYSDDAQYRQQTAEYLAELRAGVQPLWANLIDDAGVEVDEYLEVVSQADGFLNESWSTNWVPNDLSPDRWNKHLEIAERALSLGKGAILMGQGEAYDTKRQTFAFASYLLVSDGKRSYFRYSNYHDGYSGSLWQYDNYKAKLGTPKGRRYKSGNLWRRDYTCGYVTADPNTHTGTIVQTCQ